MSSDKMGEPNQTEGSKVISRSLKAPGMNTLNKAGNQRAKSVPNEMNNSTI